MLKKCIAYSTLALSLTIGITMVANKSSQQVEFTIADCVSLIDGDNNNIKSQPDTSATDSIYAASAHDEVLVSL